MMRTLGKSGIELCEKTDKIWVNCEEWTEHGVMVYSGCSGNENKKKRNEKEKEKITKID